MTMNNGGVLAAMTLVKPTFAACKLKLTKALVNVLPTTELADLTAVEADFDGYAAATITAALGPYLHSGGGGALLLPTQLFTFHTPSTPPVTNIIYNWWIETAAGDLVDAGIFSTPIPMGSIGNALAFDAVFFLGGDDVWDVHAES